MSTHPLFDQVFAGKPAPTGKLLTGRELRDSGMQSVLAHTPREWKDRLRARVEGFPRGYQFTIEKVVDDMGGRPANVHPCAMGGITFGLVKRRLMKRTGKTVKADRPSLHSTDCVLWERL